MDALSNKHTQVKLTIGRLPGRKQECFYFTEKNDQIIWPIAYISERNLAVAERLWNALLKGLSTHYNVNKETK